MSPTSRPILILRAEAERPGTKSLKLNDAMVSDGPERRIEAGRTILHRSYPSDLAVKWVNVRLGRMQVRGNAHME